MDIAIDTDTEQLYIISLTEGNQVGARLTFYRAPLTERPGLPEKPVSQIQTTEPVISNAECLLCSWVCQVAGENTGRKKDSNTKDHDNKLHFRNTEMVVSELAIGLELGNYIFSYHK